MLNFFLLIKVKNETKAINYADDFPIEVIFNKQLPKKTFIQLEDGRNWWFKECDPYINFEVPKEIDLDQKLCGSHNGTEINFGTETSSSDTQNNNSDVSLNNNSRRLGVRFLQGGRIVKTKSVFVVIENNQDEDLDFEAIFKVKGKKYLKIKSYIFIVGLIALNKKFKSHIKDLISNVLKVILLI